MQFMPVQISDFFEAILHWMQNASLTLLIMVLVIVAAIDRYDKTADLNFVYDTDYYPHCDCDNAYCDSSWFRPHPLISSNLTFLLSSLSFRFQQVYHLTY